MNLPEGFLKPIWYMDNNSFSVASYINLTASEEHEMTKNKQLEACPHKIRGRSMCQTHTAELM